MCARGQICYNTCLEVDSSYTHFGLQFAWQCWCSKKFNAADEVEASPSDCGMECVLNTSEDCGGKDFMLAYKMN